MGKDTCAVCGATFKHTFRFPTKRYIPDPSRGLSGFTSLDINIFPAQLLRFDQWAKLACVSKEKLRKNKRTAFRLCIDHFKEDDIRETSLTVRLYPGTEPSALLPYQEKVMDEAKYVPFYEEPRLTIYDTCFADVTSSSERRVDDKQDELPPKVVG